MTTDSAARPPLDRSRLATEPSDPVSGTWFELHDETPSTNAVAAERARAGAAGGLVVVTEHQSAGRGRLERVWETPPRVALTFSLVLRPSVPARAWPWVPLLTGYAVNATLRAHGFDSGVKWPNDVLIEPSQASDRPPRKVAGILVERVDTPSGPAAVIGVGLNVSQTSDELPVATATSLSLEAGTHPERTDLLLELVAAIGGTVTDWERRGGQVDADWRGRYEAVCLTVGQQVRVDLPDGSTLEGLTSGIDPDGQLVVQTGSRSVRVGAGDVIHVRPLEQ